jgi:phage terminase large subunit
MFQPREGTNASAAPISAEIPEKALFLLTEAGRFKVIHGGRGSGKSWAVARALILLAYTGKWPGDLDNPKIYKHLILCTREFQSSIVDSVHRLLCTQIEALGLNAFFEIQKNTIISLTTGAEFIFKGLHHNVQEVKSLEGVTIAWVEEAQATSKDSWQTLIPTIRSSPTMRREKHQTEIWVTYNPYLEKDPTSQRFQINPDPRAKVAEMNWADNAWFPDDMEEDRKVMLAMDPDAYEHVYNGQFLALSQATIMRGNYLIRPFETPENIDRFYYGLDFGFAESPNAATRSYILDKTLYVDYEAYARHVEIDDIPHFLKGGISPKSGRLYRGIPGADRWSWKADAARPETISYLRRQGFNIEPAKKWQGSVQDGIAHLKGFDKIVIHDRCVNLAQEARLYSFKTDQKTGEILPIVVDRHNHLWDSLRYGLDGLIHARGRAGVWAKLAPNYPARAA